MNQAMDIFQVSANSADAKPGKGTGETLVSPPSTYASLAAIPHWRRKIVSGDMTPLPLTGTAELWEFTPGKGKNRRVDWEAQRATSVAAAVSTKGNLGNEAVEMEEVVDAAPAAEAVPAPVKETMKEKLARIKAEKKAKEEAAKVEAAATLVSGPAAAEAEAEVAAAAEAPKPKPSLKEKLAAKKTAKKATAAAAAAAAPAAESALRPESLLAADVGEPISLRVPDADEEAKTRTIRFCPTCNYYLYLNEGDDSDANALYRRCNNCGYKEMDTKGGLISEILVQERSTESYKILLNEYTRRDPRLPHIRGVMKCPSETCQSNVGGAESDIIYMKYDNVNLMYLYICDVCGYKWHSRR